MAIQAQPEFMRVQCYLFSYLTISKKISYYQDIYFAIVETNIKELLQPNFDTLLIPEIKCHICCPCKGLWTCSY